MEATVYAYRPGTFEVNGQLKAESAGRNQSKRTEAIKRSHNDFCAGASPFAYIVRHDRPQTANANTGNTQLGLP